MTAPAVEAEARRYLRVFPRWMRPVRGEEAVSLVLDQLPEDATRLPMRSRVDLVRAGLHARRVGRPPGKVRRSVANATPGSSRGTVPQAWRPWLLANLPRRSFAFWLMLERTLWSFLPIAVLMAAPEYGTGWRPWRGAPFLVLWVLGAGVGALRAGRWRTIVYLRNGLLPDGQPMPPTEAADQWTEAKAPNAWAMPSLLASTTVFLAAAIAGWPAFGSPGDGIFLFWLLVATAVVGWLATVDNLIRWRLAPQRATPHAVAGAPLRKASAATIVVTAFAAGISAATVLGVSLVMGVVGMGSLARWVLVGTAVIVVVRCVQSERAQARPLGLWDLIPSAGPVLVRFAVPLPPPPDLPPTALG